MSGLELGAVLALGAWSVVLTAAVVLLAKQVVLLTARMTLVTDISSGETIRGLQVERQAEIALRAGVEGAPRYVVLLLSLTCAPCRSVAEDTRNWPSELPVAAVLHGNDAELYAHMAQLVAPRVFVVPMELTERVAGAFPTPIRPFGMLIENGQVVVAEPISTTKKFLRACATSDSHLDYVPT